MSSPYSYTPNICKTSEPPTTRALPAAHPKPATRPCRRWDPAVLIRTDHRPAPITSPDLRSSPKGIDVAAILYNPGPGWDFGGFSYYLVHQQVT